MSEDLNFLQSFTKVTERSESPAMFNLWSAIAGVSCVLGRKVWIDMGKFVVYPNMYVIFVAESGRCRKSTAIGVISDLLRDLEPRPNIIAQKITPEGLIEALRCDDTTGSVILRTRSEGFVIADELATFLNVSSYESGLGSLLVTLFDCHNEFEYRTKGRGAERISNSCLGLLGASTVDWLKRAIPADAIGSGLTSRIIFVYETAVPEPVPDPRLTTEEKALRETLARKLQRLHALEGEVRFTKGAWDLYLEEYNKFYKESPFFDNPTLTGYAARRFVHLFKLATVLAVSDQERLEIERRHFEGALTILGKTEERLPDILGLLQAVDKGANTVLVLRILEKKSPIQKSELLRRVAHKLDAKELQDVIDTLIQSKRLDVISDGRAIYYHLLG